MILKDKLQQILISKQIYLSFSYYSDHQWKLLVEGKDL